MSCRAIVFTLVVDIAAIQRYYTVDAAILPLIMIRYSAYIATLLRRYADADAAATC